jgi:hypothetical protein
MESVREATRLSGRRKSRRFQAPFLREGRLRLFRDVTLESDQRVGELSVICDLPWPADEELTLGLATRDGHLDLRVRVLESRPLIVDGVVRHRLRLLMLNSQ